MQAPCYVFLVNTLGHEDKTNQRDSFFDRHCFFFNNYAQKYDIMRFICILRYVL